MSAPRRKTVPSVELLEDRCLPTTAVLAGGTLAVKGTNGNNNLEVRQVDGRISVVGVSIKVGAQKTPSVSEAKVARITIKGFGGADTILLTPPTATQQAINKPLLARGGGGSDVITGGFGNDKLFGDGGNDALAGGDGNDLLNGGPGDDNVHGEAGTDQADFSNATAAVSVDLGSFSASGGAGADFIFTIENVSGSKFGDNLTGDGNNNLLIGAGGNDSMVGGAGSDILRGGLGNDTLFGGPGGGGTDVADYSDAPAGVTVDLAGGTAIGGAGTDTISDISDLIGSAFADILTGNAGTNFILGGAGNDFIDASLSSQPSLLKVFGGDGDDLIFGSSQGDILGGGAGNDTILGLDGADFITGDAGNDLLRQNDEANAHDGDVDILDAFDGEADQIHTFGVADTFFTDTLGGDVFI